MNTWPSDPNQYNMMNMPINNTMPPNAMQGNMAMMNDWSQMNPMMNNANMANNYGNFVPPLPVDNKEIDSGHTQSEGLQGGGNRRDDRARPGRSTDRNRDRNDRGDRSRSDRRERRSKWSDNDNPPAPNNMMMNNMGNMGPGKTPVNMGPGNMVQGSMMPYPSMMDMQQMPNMNMAPNMPNMPMNPMMTGMPMMPNMMDQNQMMMVQMQMMGQQPPMPLTPIFISNGVLLPPLPGSMPPARREKPLGCRTIFVGGIPKTITKEMITEIFQRFGPITDVQIHRQGISHVRFEKPETVEQSFFLSGYRYKLHDQTENEATSIFIDYALNHDDQSEFERNKRKREPTPPRVEPFSPQTLAAITEKIKSDADFAEVAPTLAAWLERGECNKKNANTFYSLIQASNSQVRRLYNEKMAIDEEYQNLRQSMKDKFQAVVTQFEQVAKILSAAKHQRVSDHFSKQQRRNIEMWLKMTEDLENIREEFNTMYDETEESDNKNSIALQKYEQLKQDHQNLIFELEGYKNEAFLAKDEAERKFEKFKAQYIAAQALHSKDAGHKQQDHQNLIFELEGYKNEAFLAKDEAERKFEKFKAQYIAAQALHSKDAGHKQVFPPLPPPPLPPIDAAPLPPTPSIPDLEAKIISVLTAYLLAQPLGASLESLVTYVRSIVPNASQVTVNNVLGKYPGLFSRAAGGWMFVTFDIIKKERA